MILIPQLNPLRFIDLANTNAGFDGNLYINQIGAWQKAQCYFQPWQRSDKLILQCISTDIGESPAILNIRNLRSELITTISWTASIIGLISHPNYKVWNLSMDFSVLAEGYYYAEFGNFASESFSVQQTQPFTTLLKYTNSQNNFGVLFFSKTPSIEFQFRLESTVQYDEPGLEKNVYIDQLYNPTQLSAVKYRKYKFYIGYKYGVPNWVVDKYASILQCDQISYDGEFYQIPPDGDPEYQKNDNNNYIGANFPLIASDNNFIKYISNMTGVTTLIRRSTDLLDYGGGNYYLPVPIYQEMGVVTTIQVFDDGVTASQFYNGTNPNGTAVENILNNSASTFYVKYV